MSTVHYDEIIRPRSPYWIVVLAVSVMFMVLGVWAVSQSAGEQIGAYTLLLGSGVVAITALFHLPKSSFLGLTAEGLTVRFRWRTSFLAWRDIAHFGVAEFRTRNVGGQHLQRTVGLSFVRRLSADERGNALRWLNKRVTGFEAVLPNDYGRDCSELAAYLNGRREHFLS